MSNLTDQQLNEMFERSKDDRKMFVGSEIRQLIGMIRRFKQDQPADNSLTNPDMGFPPP